MDFADDNAKILYVGHLIDQSLTRPDVLALYYANSHSGRNSKKNQNRRKKNGKNVKLSKKQSHGISNVGKNVNIGKNVNVGKNVNLGKNVNVGIAKELNSKKEELIADNSSILPPNIFGHTSYYQPSQHILKASVNGFNVKLENNGLLLSNNYPLLSLNQMGNGVEFEELSLDQLFSNSNLCNLQNVGSLDAQSIMDMDHIDINMNELIENINNDQMIHNLHTMNNNILNGNGSNLLSDLGLDLNAEELFRISMNEQFQKQENMFVVSDIVGDGQLVTENVVDVDVKGMVGMGDVKEKEEVEVQGSSQVR